MTAGIDTLKATQSLLNLLFLFIDRKFLPL